MFTRHCGSGLYTLTIASAQVAELGHVAASSRVSASGQLATSCSLCTPVSLSLAFPSPCPPSRTRLHRRAFPASRGGTTSEFPPTTAPLHTLHMDVWGPAPADVSGVLIPWIRATRHQLRERFLRDLPLPRLHSDRGGEFSSDLLEEFCRDEGIRQTFTLPASPQLNGIGERHIGLIMEVARTSIIHAAAPYFLWPFAVRYAAHQLSLWPRVSEPETSPTLRWTGKVGDASVFRVWGALSLVCNAKASKLSPRTLRCVFLGFPTNAPPWQFYHSCERRVFSSHDVTFDESGPAPSGVSQVDPPPLDEPVEMSSDSSGPAEGGDPAADDTAAARRSPCLETHPGFPPRPSLPPPQPAAVDSGATVGGDTRGADSRGAATEGTETEGAVSPCGGGAVGDLAGGPGVGQPQQPGLHEMRSPQWLREWIVQRGRPSGGGYGLAGTGGSAGAGGAGAVSAVGAGGAASAGGTGGTAGAKGARAASLGGLTGGAADARGPRGAAGADAGGTGGATGAASAGAVSLGGAAGAGGAGAATTGGAAGAGGAARAGGTAGAGDAGAASPRGPTRGAAGAGGPQGAAGAGGTGGATGAGGAGAASLGGAVGAGGAGSATTRGLPRAAVAGEE
ncbi:unnamed protein product [Closterium sp. NIES-53]